LAKRFPLATSGISFNALHPGLVDTGLLATAPGMSAQAKTIDDGIMCCMHLSTSQEVEGISGEYYHENSAIAQIPSEVSEIALSEEAQDDCFANTLALLSISEEQFGVAVC